MIRLTEEGLVATERGCPASTRAGHRGCLARPAEPRPLTRGPARGRARDRADGDGARSAYQRTMAAPLAAAAAGHQGRVVSALHLKPTGRWPSCASTTRAKLNALTVPMLEALDAHCAALERRRGAGGHRDRPKAKAFCTGADITAWGPMAPFDFACHWVARGHRIFDRLARLRQADDRGAPATPSAAG